MLDGIGLNLATRDRESLNRSKFVEFTISELLELLSSVYTLLCFVESVETANSSLITVPEKVCILLNLVASVELVQILEIPELILKEMPGTLGDFKSQNGSACARRWALFHLDILRLLIHLDLNFPDCTACLLD